VREAPAVAAYREYPRARSRSAAGRPYRRTDLPLRDSHAAIPVAVVAMAAGLYLARYTLLLPGLIGILLLAAGVSFLSARLNPLSPHFYLDRKPSWAAVGVVLLGALALLAFVWTMAERAADPWLPRF
jgi:hypothetical protein